MGMLNPPYGLWSIWKQLSLLQHGMADILGLFGIYSLFSALRVILQLRSMRRQAGESSVAMAALHSHCSNMRQMISILFYLFGFVLFMGLQGVGNTLGGEKTPIYWIGYRNFVLDCAFAANLFLVFFVLQLIQWFVCARVNSLARSRMTN
jgi:hypothetical protein